ncbi:MAG: molybdenum cofactor guanylyltransferase [Acidobacteriota bacterium]|nr:molybdenum cofactor guanylyltransferase [Acidobacteriota bacterium]
MSLPDSGSAEAVGFVLAGGQSSRMGADKALTQLDGEPLVVRALEVLREAGLPAAIAGARSPLGGFAPVVEDAAFGRGPLGGVCAGLAATDAERVVFLSVDMPLLPASLVSYLVRHAQITGAAVTVPSVNGFAQTFPAVVDRAALPALEASLKAGTGGCFSAFQAAAAEVGLPFSILPVESLAQPGHVNPPDGLPAALWFLNVNSPAELERAQALLAAFHRVS